MNRPNENPSDTASSQMEETHPNIVLARADITQWDGPLPPPEAFQSYENTLPGAAERLLAIAESWHQHQIEQERGALELAGKALEGANAARVGESRRAYLGIVLGFILTLTGLAGGIFLATLGYGGIGLAFGLPSLAALGAVFVYGARSRSVTRLRNVENTEGE